MIHLNLLHNIHLWIFGLPIWACGSGYGALPLLRVSLTISPAACMPTFQPTKNHTHVMDLRSHVNAITFFFLKFSGHSRATYDTFRHSKATLTDTDALATHP